MTQKPNINFAIIAPLGTDIDLLQEILASEISAYKYELTVVKFTDLLKRFPDKLDVKYKDKFNRYEKYITAGNKIVDLTERKDILAIGAVTSAFELTKTQDKEKNYCKFFRQIKRPQEIDFLKQAYKDRIKFIGCYTPKDVRIEKIVGELRETNRELGENELRSQALKLIGIDENEKNTEGGQRFLDCYPLSDFIIDCSSRETIKDSITRLLKSFFGYHYISPTPEEYGLSIANLVSARSTDLSRQVGAAIISDDNIVISLGCNEVPKAFGGTYWDNNTPDKRDYQKGFDSNAKVKSDIIREVLSRLQKNWLKEDYLELSHEELEKKALEKEGPLQDAMVDNLIEFGRMVHAEMNAITDAARVGRSLDKSTLFCTTMPCHLCAKHIVASGIKKVIYLQPYHKSLVEELYPDSITIDNPLETKVSFEPFKGVTPRSYQQVFQKTYKRKKEKGKILDWNPSESIPIFVESMLNQMETVEAKAVKTLSEIVKNKNLT